MFAADIFSASFVAGDVLFRNVILVQVNWIRIPANSHIGQIRKNRSTSDVVVNSHSAWLHWNHHPPLKFEFLVRSLVVNPEISDCSVTNKLSHKMRDTIVIQFYGFCQSVYTTRLTTRIQQLVFNIFNYLYIYKESEILLFNQLV